MDFQSCKNILYYIILWYDTFFYSVNEILHIVLKKIVGREIKSNVWCKLHYIEHVQAMQDKKG